jgi:hypothetical protein
MKISVVVPVYGCPEALETLHKRLTDTLLRITEDYDLQDPPEAIEQLYHQLETGYWKLLYGKKKCGR